jgi:serine/threonine protein kinase/Tol biopolymer transport system component
MSLQIGQELGSYEITSLLGKGGMGEVYRARDTKLKRDVAIKILPEEFSLDPERVSRFQREAEALAALNHQNIGAIYDLQQADDTRFLILELVEGETLADLLAKRGALPVEDVLNIAKQIGEALEAAHEKGVVHRDLKPANIKITPEGKVKVLDFGLAKALETPSSNATVSNSPTMLSGTMGGMIVGTAAYMSPEQARGRVADQRSDVFAFGCVLYEMLTARQAFQGEDVSEVLASVIKGDVDLSLLPSNVMNPRLHELLRRCLAKDRKKRWYAIGDVRVEIEAIADANGPEFQAPVAEKAWPRLWKRAIAFMVTAVLVASLTTILIWNSRPREGTHLTRFSYVLPQGQRFSRTGRHLLAISPDGTNIVYVANNQLYLRTMAEMDGRPIQGTDSDPDTPFFSPDGQWVAFHSNKESRIKKIALTGGASVTICDAQVIFGADWTRDDQIFFAAVGAGLQHVSANGGKPDTVIQVKAGEETHGPQLLPDGDTLLFTFGKSGQSGLSLDRWDKAQIVIQSLKTGTRKVLIEGGSDAHYLATGHVVYALGSTVLAVPFDVKNLRLTGGPVPMIEGVYRASGTQGSGAAHLSFSADGAMVYIPGLISNTTGRFLVFADLNGSRKAIPLPPGEYFHPRISPDGKRLVVGTDDGKDAIVWIYDLASTTAIRRLTFGSANRFPIWSRDGQRVVFQSDREKDLGLFWQNADGNGSAERLTKPEEKVSHTPSSWSSDGKSLVVALGGGRESRIGFVSMDDASKTKTLFNAPSAGNIVEASISPDGHWMAYDSFESGRSQIYVQPFPPMGAKYQVTNDNSGQPQFPIWSPDGKEIFYALGQGGGRADLMSIAVQTRPSFSFGKATPLPIKSFWHNGAPGAPRGFDITPDGKEFVIMVPSSDEASERQTAQIYVALHWFEELKRRVPVK